MNKFWKKFKVQTILTAAFMLLVMFVLPGNMVECSKVSRSIHKMEGERTRSLELSCEDSTFIENMKDDDFLEKYARENFYMKRKGEQIYLIEE